MALSDAELNSAERKCMYIFAGIVIGLIALIIFLSVLIPAFKYVGYNEYAFKQNRFGEVDRSKVYTQGRYVFSPIYRFIKLPSTYQLIDISLTVFSDLGLEFTIHLIVYYQLPKENLGEIYHQFSLNYENRISNIIKTTVKDIATNYNVDDYIINRVEVEDTFSAEVHSQLKSTIGVDIPSLYFRLLNIDFPQTVIDSSLTSAIELQNNQIQKYKQDVAVIEADTNNMITAVNLTTNLTIATANIQANGIISNSISEANAIVIAAKGEGMQTVMDLLNITNTYNRNEFIRLVSILDGNSPKILQGDFTPLINIG